MATLRSCSTCGLQRTMLFWSSSSAAIRSSARSPAGLRAAARPPTRAPPGPRRARAPPPPAQGRKAGAVAAQKRGPLEEIVARPAPTRNAPCGRRQHVVRAADIVADHLGRERPEEDRAGVPHGWRQRLGPGPISSRCSGASASISAPPPRSGRTTSIAPCVAPACARRSSRAPAPPAAPRRRRRPRRRSPVVGDQDRLRALVMLGLGQQVRGDPGGIDHGLGHDHDLRRARRSCRCRPGRTPAAWLRRHRRCPARRSCRPERCWPSRRPAPPPPGPRRRGRSRPRRRCPAAASTSGSTTPSGVGTTITTRRRPPPARGWRSSGPSSDRRPSRRAHTARPRRPGASAARAERRAASTQLASVGQLPLVEGPDPRGRGPRAPPPPRARIRPRAAAIRAAGTAARPPLGGAGRTAPSARATPHRPRAGPRPRSRPPTADIDLLLAPRPSTRPANAAANPGSRWSSSTVMRARPGSNRRQDDRTG